MPILCVLTAFKSKIIMKIRLNTVVAIYIYKKSVENEKTITNESYGIRYYGLFD